MAMVLTGCSKDEKIQNPDGDNSFAELTFEATLNDLVNRAASVNKDHFDEIPNCSDTEPAYVELEIAYAGQAAETMGTITIEILKDGDGYFTKYSDLLKIPVADDDAVMVTLNKFIVFNASNEMIWIAPFEAEDEQGLFDGYVDEALPFEFPVQDGTKPYIDVEVLCYDDRMVNEYGYVFFDLENTELIEFCIFGNFCPPSSGRHYLASYGVNVWTVNEQGANVEQLYNSDELYSDVVENNAGELSADPVCMVLPDRLDEEDRYRIDIIILEGPDDGEVIRTAILTDEEVRTFFAEDGFVEYYHFFEGCDEPDTPPVFDDPRDDVMVYKTCAKGLNDSGVIALATASIDGDFITVTVLATGMQTGMEHPQHIHGFTDAEPRMLEGGGTTRDAICPPDSASGDDDIITIGEGLPFYGGVQLPLEVSTDVFPTPDGMGNYIYQRTFPMTADLSGFEDKVVVLHGLDTDNPLLPVACGEFVLVE